MNANDATISRVFVTKTGGLVPDPTPNESNGATVATFDLVVQGEAGRVIGNSGADYKLAVVAYDLTAGANAAFGVPPVDQSFVFPLWTQSGDDFVSTQRFPQPVPAGVNNHVFRYTASLVAKNGQVVAFAQSDLFILL